MFIKNDFVSLVCQNRKPNLYHSFSPLARPPHTHASGNLWLPAFKHCGLLAASTKIIWKASGRPLFFYSDVMLAGPVSIFTSGGLQACFAVNYPAGLRNAGTLAIT